MLHPQVLLQFLALNFVPYTFRLIINQILWGGKRRRGRVGVDREEGRWEVKRRGDRGRIIAGGTC
jgi:hypothetical protein